MNVCSSRVSASAEKIPVLAGDVKVLSNDFLSLPTPLIHVAISLATDLNNMFRQHLEVFPSRTAATVRSLHLEREFHREVAPQVN